jgi:hypothetical protein
VGGRDSHAGVRNANRRFSGRMVCAAPGAFVRCDAGWPPDLARSPRAPSDEWLLSMKASLKAAIPLSANSGR